MLRGTKKGYSFSCCYEICLDRMSAQSYRRLLHQAYKELVDEVVAAPMHIAGQRELNGLVLYV